MNEQSDVWIIVSIDKQVVGHGDSCEVEKIPGAPGSIYGYPRLHIWFQSKELADTYIETEMHGYSGFIAVEFTAFNQLDQEKP